MLCPGVSDGPTFTILSRPRSALVARRIVGFRNSHFRNDTSPTFWCVVGHILQVYILKSVVCLDQLHNSSPGFSRTGIRLKSAVTTMLFKKVMRLSSLGDTSIGEVMTTFIHYRCQQFNFDF